MGFGLWLIYSFSVARLLFLSLFPFPFFFFWHPLGKFSQPNSDLLEGRGGGGGGGGGAILRQIFCWQPTWLIGLVDLAGLYRRMVRICIGDFDPSSSPSLTKKKKTTNIP